MSTTLDCPPSRRLRKVPKGDREVNTYGLPKHFWQDLYHHCLTASWPVFFGSIVLVYLLLNTLFALLYLCGSHAIANAEPGFLSAFFFSVETLATVGYGDMHPQTVYAHLVSSVEMFFGMGSIAVITGLVFARFSRPRARLLFARHPVVASFDGQSTFMIRMANARQNVVIDASAKLRMLRQEITAEGVELRRIHDLPLIRHETPVFSLGWTVMHVVDAASPLYGESAESLSRADSAFILTVQGFDETTSQQMLARQFFSCETVRWQHRYVDVMSVDQEGRHHLDYSKFHDLVEE
jgi:inward rectifier potassium channel